MTKKLCILVVSTIGSSLGWWIGARLFDAGMFGGFIASMLGTGVGIFYGAKLAREIS